MNKLSVLGLGCLLAGCSASSEVVKSVTLPTSNVKIDVVQHRSDVKLADCGTLVVLQTYDASGKLIDSKEARGQSLLCDSVPALIDAGARVGAARAVRPAITKISNSVSSASGSSATATGIGGSGGSASATGGSGGNGGQGGQGGNGGTGGSGGNGGGVDGSHGDSGNHGNNGIGNGSDDGTNPGTDHSHTGDNS